jgi:O-antigen ligase
MKERTDTISDYKSETSAEMRLTAWEGGLKMIESHPLLGVGLGSFITALPDFIETSPRVAHNTFMQFAAESGVAAGICYLVIIFLFFRNSKKISSWCRENGGIRISTSINRYNDACTSSFAGLTMCSLFLSLNTYEIFYFLLIISNTLLVCINKPLLKTELQLGDAS